MIDFSQLPKEPLEALQTILKSIIDTGDGEKVNIGALKKQKHNLYFELNIATIAANQTIARIDNKDVQSLAQEYLILDENFSLRQVQDRANYVLQAVIAAQLNSHFLPDEEVNEFELANLNQDDIEKIRRHLGDARDLVQRSNILPRDHQRRIILRIAKVENELYKEKAGISAFFAAAYEASALTRQFGEDVQPIAEAIEKARTITEKKVSGYAKLEASEKPKQLPKPED